MAQKSYCARRPHEINAGKHQFRYCKLSQQPLSLCACIPGGLDIQTHKETGKIFITRRAWLHAACGYDYGADTLMPNKRGDAGFHLFGMFLMKYLGRSTISITSATSLLIGDSRASAQYTPGRT